MKNMMKPGTLIQLSSKAKESLKEKEVPRFWFCPVGSDGIIRNDLFWEGRELMVPETILLFVESLDYSEKTTAWKFRPLSATAAAVATSLSARAAWENARKEFKTTGKIPGGIFLVPNGQLIWISHIDLDYFEQYGKS